jgi:hypothetical protein
MQTDAAPDATATAFARCCAAGLWFGLGRTIAGRLDAAGIRNAEDVTTDALTKIESVGAKRAQTLVRNFEDAQPRFRVAELLDAAGLPLRLAIAAVEDLGRDASTTLCRDPW